MNENLENKQVRMLKLGEILPNRFQPRIHFDEQALNELSASIRQHGVIQPIIVRPLGDKYEIIAGERRYKASTLANVEEIPAIVVDLNDKESSELALIENVQRQDLTPIEEAISYKKILSMGYLKQEELASRLGKTQSTIANKLRLLNLSPDVQDALMDGKISERHARSLLKLKDLAKQDLLLDRIIKERLTVRKTDEEINNMIDSKDVEVLDFNKEVASPEQIKDPLKQFDSLYNIPTTAIVEDSQDENLPKIPNITAAKSIFDEANEGIPTAEVKPIEPIQTSFATVEEARPIEPVSTIAQEENPGFTDINKIEQNASDINVEPRKISLEELLKSPGKVVSTAATEVQPPIQPVVAEEKATEPEDDSLFKTGKFFTMMDEGKEQFVPTPSPVTTPESTIFEPNSLDNKGFNVAPESQLADLLKDTPKVNPVPLEKVDEGFDMPVTEIEEDEGETIPTAPLQNEDEDLDKTMVFDSVPSNISNLSEFKMPPLDDFAAPTPEVSPAPAPAEYSPVYEDEEKPEAVDNNKYGAADLRTVINTIRNCAATIEKYGYVLDTEEFDFEDMYQVIFKVQKKK
ncbi:MAG: ParB/RepB/Spo0J family partition protein [Bacilli bacterium]|nr:ParB/RepB/Spo0J family partition protein [Bacilli bacterium]